MKTATTRCGACSMPPGPGTRPGLMVVKRNAPWSSVGMRPKPLNPRSSRFFCWSSGCAYLPCEFACQISTRPSLTRSEEHTSELQSRLHLVCRLLLEKKKRQNKCDHH